MALAFPSPYFHMIGLKPITGISFIRDSGGLNVTSRNSDAFWAGPMTTGQLELAEQRDWVGFLNLCVEENQRIDWVNPRYKVPFAYLNAVLPFSGTAVLVSLTDLKTIVVSGMSIGLELRRGDRLTFEQNGLVCHREIAQTLTVSSTTIQSLPISPRLPAGLFSAGAEVKVKDPKIRLQIVPDSFDPVDVTSPTGITFEAVEVYK